VSVQPPTLEAHRLGYRRGARWLLRGIDLRLSGGELAVLLGPNGAGKTTLLRLLAGELHPSEGEVRWGGRPLGQLPPLAQARERAVFSQHQELAFPFSAYEVAFLGRLPHLEGRPETSHDHQVTRQALHQTDSAHLAERAYPSLSGGEAVRVALARVLAQEPRLLLLDEPTNHLDPPHQLEVLRLLLAQSRAGRTVMAVLHDLNLAALFADRLLLLHQGRLVADGPPAEVLTAGRLEAVYGLKAAVMQHPSGRPWVLPLL